jgi:hypothetical protein
LISALPQTIEKGRGAAIVSDEEIKKTKQNLVGAKQQ